MKMFNAVLLGLLLLLIAPLARAADANGTSQPQSQNVVDVLRNDPRYSIFVQSLEATGLDQTLRGAGPFIVFAPTNDAFKRLPNLADLQKNPEALKPVLKYHIIPFGKTQSKDLADLKFATTLQGEEVHFSKDKVVLVNGASIVQADLPASNGVVHGIDQMLLPKSVPSVRAAAAVPPQDNATVVSTQPGVVTDANSEVVYDTDADGGFSGAGHTMYGGLKHGASKFKHFFTGGN